MKSTVMRVTVAVAAVSFAAVAHAPQSPKRTGSGLTRFNLFTPKNEALYAHLGWQTFEKTAINGVPVYLMARSTR